MTHDLVCDLSGAATAAALLTAEHLLMFDRRDTYHPLARYTAGTAALAIGHTVACALAGDPRGALRLWLVVAGEGHEELEAHGWRAVEWFAAGFLKGGMGVQSADGHQQHRERLWLSPHCCQPAAVARAEQGALWEVA